MLSGKVALVTDASGGLGQAMAIGLAEAGADIIAVSLSESVQTVQHIETLVRKAQLITADLSREDLLAGVVAEALSYYCLHIKAGSMFPAIQPASMQSQASPKRLRMNGRQRGCM